MYIYIYKYVHKYIRTHTTKCKTYAAKLLKTFNTNKYRTEERERAKKKEE